MISPAPISLSSLISSGTSALCPAARELTPTCMVSNTRNLRRNQANACCIRTTCTSASTACCATSFGVWKSGPMSTSKPISANPVATTCIVLFHCFTQSLHTQVEACMFHTPQDPLRPCRRQQLLPSPEGAIAVPWHRDRARPGPSLQPAVVAWPSTR